jgi:hypothetical protein
MARRHVRYGLRELVWPLVLATGAITLSAGCGGDDDAPAAESKRLTLTPGDAPTVEQCGFSELETADSAARRKTLEPPEAGAYTYRTKGTETASNEGRSGLDPINDLVVTRPLKQGDLTCFGFEREFSPTTAVTNVYIQRGEDTYISAIGVATANYVTTIEPRPAILAAAGAGTRWSGQFSGATSGTYEVEIFDRRTISVGGERVEAVGLDSHATYHGETEGSQDARTWLATDHPLILSEQAQLVIKVGSATNRIDYESELTSLDPEPAGG